MSNFEFIRTAFPALAKSAMEAERLIFISPPAAIALTRQALEHVVDWLYQYDKRLKRPFDTTLNSLMSDAGFKQTLPEHIWQAMNAVRRVGNKVVHKKTVQTVNEEDAIKVVSQLFMIFIWLERTYGSPSVDRTESHSFENANIPRPPADNPQAAIDLQQIRAENEAFEQQLAAQRDALKQRQDAIDQMATDLGERERLLAEQDAELAAMRAQLEQIRAANEAYNATHPDPNQYDEATTRKLLIDLMLAEAGWRVGENALTELKVAGFASSSGRGFCDYVLMGENGLPLAVIEAKRTSQTAQAGQQQAKLYADSLTAHYGQRPIIFYTNGFETFLWDDVQYPPRKVQGFYTQDELNRLIERRNLKDSENTSKHIQKLADQPINAAIVERYYQNRAIKSLLNTFDSGKRAGLLIMATGTGKTRTAIALVDALIRANRVQKVLFLADRTALVRQAATAFRQHLPNIPLVNLVEARNQNGRVYLSTYQTMMGLIDARHDDETRKFGVGMFDMIIIDEAHRSVYEKFGEIFRYFDSLLVGLTATPRDEVDRNTYQLFGLENGMPTDYYSLEEAIRDKNLVPPKSFDVPIKIVREGLKYDDLSDEEKAHWDSLDWGSTAPDEVSASQVNKRLFNKDTVDKMLKHLMENGIKVNQGDRLGKTIIFAVNQRHADFIAERFDANYPAYKGSFASTITHSIKHANTLIDAFAKKDLPEPQIAISVDMLDTGIDVPEIVNLVFFKAVRSKIKFMQMIGRGTRLCPDLFGPGQDKTEFYVFDYCGNFDYFNQHPEGATATSAEPLPKKLFKKRVNVLRLLATSGYQHEQFQQLGYGKLAQQLKTGLQAEVNSMNAENFIVRSQWQHVSRFKQSQSWNNLDESAIKVLNEYIAGLPTELASGLKESLEARLFDGLCLDLQEALLEKRPKLVAYCRQQIVTIAEDLETKANIPAIARQIELIQLLQSDEYWQSINPVVVEKIRESLRELIGLLDKQSIKVVYSNFEDSIGQAQEVSLPPQSGVNIEQYRKRVESFIRANEDHITIAKLKRGLQLTEQDLSELEKFVYDAQEVAGEAQFKACFGIQQALPAFIRSLVGLDRQAVQTAFSEYLIGNRYNERQIRFIEMIIEALTRQGRLEKSRLYEAPFNQLHPEGIDGIFTQDQDVIRIFEVLESFDQMVA